MISHWKSIAAATVIGLAVSATGASAQIGWAIGGGPSFATGDLGDVVDMGYNVQGSASLSIPVLPVGIRIDGLYNKHPSEFDENHRTFAGNVNAVFSFPSIGITPYVIGGLGMYNTKIEHDDDQEVGHDHESSSDVGFNIGAGVRLGLPGLSVFGEARLHSISAEGGSVRFVPVTLGIRF